MFPCKGHPKTGNEKETPGVSPSTQLPLGHFWFSAGFLGLVGIPLFEPVGVPVPLVWQEETLQTQLWPLGVWGEVFFADIPLLFFFWGGGFTGQQKANPPLWFLVRTRSTQIALFFPCRFLKRNVHCIFAGGLSKWKWVPKVDWWVHSCEKSSAKASSDPWTVVLVHSINKESRMSSFQIRGKVQLA